MDSLRPRSEKLWKTFNNLPQFIPYLQKAPQLELWHRTTLGCVVIRLRTHFRHLCNASCLPYETEYMAWAARNLLELAVWAKYTTASQENARRLHDDQVIDLSELQRGILSLLEKYEPNHPQLGALLEQGEWLETAKDESHIEKGRRHLYIGSIAREVGMAELFRGLNGLLSKLVHPTSFSVMLDLNQAGEAQLRQSLFAIGIGGAEDALKDLIACFDSVGIDSGLLGPPPY